MKRKNTKNEKPSIEAIIANETNPVKKKALLKKRNKSIKKKINITNMIYYIVAVLSSIPVNIAIRIMISEITNNTYYTTIYSICLLCYYCIAVLIYLKYIYPKYEKYEKELNDNNVLIEELNKDSGTEITNFAYNIKFNRFWNSVGQKPKIDEIINK